MKIAYFDCFCGAAGDMILAALLDAGAPLETLTQTVAALKLAGVSVQADIVKRHGIAARHVRVTLSADAPRKHRHLHHIEALIGAAALAPDVAERALAIFRRLAQAEAEVHQTSVAKVHFHEVGADDAIVDIVGACALLAALGVQRVECSPIPVGSGTVQCDHGLMPVPAPATARLLRDVPIAACEETGELTTPTGAAILSTLAGNYGPPPSMTLRAAGVGAGTREGRTRPNILRVLVGESADSADLEHDFVCVLEAQLDDMTGQALAHALENLLAAGALDAYLTPILMKKGRPGHLLTVLSAQEAASRIERLILTQTSTFGVRRHEAQRAKLSRAHVTVPTRFGDIRVKLGRIGEATVHAWPEYEDCAAAARRCGASLWDVQQEALHAWTRGAAEASDRAR